MHPTQVAQLSEAVQAEKFELMNATQENERLREQIVQVGSCDLI